MNCKNKMCVYSKTCLKAACILCNYEHFSKKKYFLFKSFVKVELSYVVTINLISTAENCMEVNYLIKTGAFSLICNYLRPSNNSRQVFFNINAVVLVLIIC